LVSEKSILRQNCRMLPLHKLLYCIATCICLTSNVALAEELGTRIQLNPAVRSTGAPILFEAESASQDPSSIVAQKLSSPLPALPNLADPKDRKSAPNCQALMDAAAAHNLPPDFFVRLIRQESNFDPSSVSHKGAQGIAQFMPGTARWRGLADPLNRSRRCRSQHDGSVNCASNLAISDWQPLRITRDPGEFRNGLEAAAIYPAKRAPMSASLLVVPQRNGRRAILLTRRSASPDNFLVINW
jgi:hypothetical protein